MENKRISEKQVKKIALLSMLNVSGEEDKFAEMFSETLDYIAILDELDLASVSETFQVTGSSNVFQKEDESCISLSRDEALSNANDIHNGLFSTAAVFNRN